MAGAPTEPETEATAETVPGHKGAARPAALAHTKIDRFVVREQLGAGGMGVVLAAHDPRLDRRVALKLVAGAALRANGRERLLREGQAMARLSHPNVVTVYEAGTVGDDVFLVMELVEGRTLRAWLAAQPHRWGAILDVFLAAGRGLAAAHRQGLVHRDFKPDNVLVGNDGRARVMDFGLVDAAAPAPVDTPPPEEPALSTELTRTGAVMGTPLYMSPEQHLGEEVDARADQWAFCVSLFEALWGKPPFPGKTMDALRASVLEGRLEEPAGGSVPASVHRAVLRGLRRDPAQRYPSMDALLADLAAAPVRRRRIVLGGSITAGALVTGSVLFMLARRTAREYAPPPPPDPCEGVAAPLDAVWNPARGDQVRSSLTGVARAGAAFTADKVVSMLDEHGDAWSKKRVEVCRATAVSGSQSSALLDLRMHCLDEELSKLDATVAAFIDKPDADTIDHGVAVASEAMYLPRCDDTQVLLAAYPLPVDKVARTKIELLTRRLDTVAVLLRFGRVQPATEQIGPLLEEIRAANYPPLLAEALLRRADASRYAGDADAMAVALREGIQAAATAPDDELEADHYRALVMVLAQSGHVDDALKLLEPARAALARFGDPPRERALLLRSEGYTHYARADYAKALELWTQTLALQRELPPEARPDLVDTLGDIAAVEKTLGQFPEALAHQREALAIEIEEIGPDHPDTIETLVEIGSLQQHTGDVDGARATFEDALHRAETVHGAHSTYAATTRGKLAGLLADKGDYAAAGPQYEAALADLADRANEYVVLLFEYCNHWVQTTETPASPAEAISVCERAEAKVREVFGADNPRAALASGMVAEALLMDGQAVEAEKRFRQQRKDLEATAGADHPYVVMPMNGIARALQRQKKYREAVKAYEELVARLEAQPLDPGYLLQARYGLAMARWDAGQKKAAIADGEAALALAVAGGDELFQADIEQWLKDHR